MTYLVIGRFLHCIPSEITSITQYCDSGSLDDVAGVGGTMLVTLMLIALARFGCIVKSPPSLTLSKES